MYMTNEEWEQNNQDYLKESYAIRLNLLSERIDIVKPVGWPRSGKTLNDTDMKYILRRISGNGRYRSCAPTTLRSSMQPLPRPPAGSMCTA